MICCEVASIIEETHFSEGLIGEFDAAYDIKEGHAVDQQLISLYTGQEVGEVISSNFLRRQDHFCLLGLQQLPIDAVAANLKGVIEDHCKEWIWGEYGSIDIAVGLKRADHFDAAHFDLIVSVGK